MSSLILDNVFHSHPISGTFPNDLLLVQGLPPFHISFSISSFSISSTRFTLSSFNAYSRITAFNSLPVGSTGTHWLLILTETNDFYVLSLQRKKSRSNDDDNDNDKFIHNLENTAEPLNEFFQLKVVKHINILEISLKKLNKQSSIDKLLSKKYVNTLSKTFIEVDPSGRFIYISTRPGFIEVLEFLSTKDDIFQMISDNTYPSNGNLLKLPKYTIFEDLQSFWINDDIIINMYSFNNSYVQLITKNIDMSYNLSFYQLIKSGKSWNFKKNKLVHRFDSKPDLIIPFNYFSIFCFNDHHIIYPIPEIDLSYTQIKDDDTISLQLNRLINKLSLNSGLHTSLITYHKLNDKSIILVTSNLDIYLLHLSYNYIPSEYEISINSSIRKRTRSNDVEYSNSIISIEDWSIKQINDSKPEISNHFIQLNETIVNDNTIPSIKIHIPYQFSKTSISDSLIDNNDDVYFAQNSHSSTISIPSFNIDVEHHEILKFFKLNLYIVALVKSQTDIISNTFKEFIKIYDNDICVATYQLEEGINVTNMRQLENFKSFLPEYNDFTNEDVYNLEKLLNNSFLVLSESFNYDDYVDDEDYFKRNRTEILLFIINENKELELKTMSILNYRITCFDQLDNRTFILWGYKMQFNLALEIFKNDVENKLDFKFIITLSKKVPQVENHITITKKLKKKLSILIDPFAGIYLTRIDTSNIVIKPKLLFKWKLISAIDVYSEDFIIFGDYFGNLFTINVNYGEKIPSLEIHSMFNLCNSPITTISSYKNTKIEGNRYKLCTIGTDDGNIYNLIGNYKNNAELTKLTKLNNKMVISQIKENFEYIANPYTIDMMEKDPIKHNIDLFKLRIDHFLKTSLLTDLPLDNYDESKEISIIIN